MKKTVSICLLFSFISLIGLTAFHSHGDAEKHSDCSICISTSLLSGAISPSGVITHVDFTSSYIVLFQPQLTAPAVIRLISNRGPPVV